MTPETAPSVEGIAADYRIDARGKRDRVLAALDNLGVAEALRGFTACDRPQGFRGRAHFSIEPDANGPRLFGVDPRFGAAPFESLRWILPTFAQGVVLATYERILRRDSFPAINGFDLRIAHGRTECHIQLTAQKAHESNHAPLAEAILSEIPEITGVAVPSKGLALGAAFLNHSLHGWKIAQHYSAFFQTNLRLTPGLTEVVQSAIRTAPNPELIDLYCGVGLHSIPAAQFIHRVIGADNHPGAIESARRNAEFASLPHADFALKSADAFAASLKPPPNTTVILNPPRSGCSHQVIRSVAAWRPERIINVSCCLETHIENLGLWRRLGWRPERIEAFDMFPFTPYVETVTELKRAE